MKRKERIIKATLTVLIAIGAVFCGVWVQRQFWPESKKTRDGAELEGVLFPVTHPFDWENPPLPPQSEVMFKLMRGTDEAENRRLQFICRNPATPQIVAGCYHTLLAEKGWKKYNGQLPEIAEFSGEFYRQGNLSLLLNIFADKDGGSTFRLSVLTLRQRAAAPDSRDYSEDQLK